MERQTFKKKIGELAKLPIEILQLPTYAPWTNLIEKLWRWVRQSVLHLHRIADDWQALQQRVMAFMQQFQGGSEKLLRYVGLLPD
ncbi:MAG: transposase [Candidatus Poribacteria bacterium]|nr:transposase [Candidatus Poribacteria bacterium]